jgi:hypothetical protein
MAFDPKPNSLFASWSEDGTNITVPIASITDLTAVEADGVTGDSRAVMLRILDHVFTYMNTLPAADKPTKLSITRNRREQGGAIVYQYVTQISTEVVENAVEAE